MKNDLKELKKKLAALSVAGTMAASAVGFGAPEVFADETISEGVKTEEEADYSYKSDLTSDKKEVEKWLEEKDKALKEKYEVTEKKIIEVENQVISTEEKEINEVFDTEESAKERKNEIEKGDIKDSTLSIEKNDAIAEEINESFDTEQEALEFIEKCREKGNSNLSVSEIYSDWVSKGTIKVKELSGLTEEERDREIERITKEIEGNSNDTIRYEVSVTKTSKTEKVYVKDNITEETKVFNSLKEANDFIDSLKLSENENIKVEINGPKINQVLISSESSKIEEIFESEKELDEYIKQLEKQGYTLGDITKEEVVIQETEKVPTGKVIVEGSKKLDSRSKYEVNGNYIMIKQASGSIAIWTNDELTKEEQESFMKSWFAGNYDNSIKDNVNVYFIFGEGKKDLSYIGNGWGTYNISTEDNKIIMTCNSDRISHLNYGKFEQEYIEKKVDVTKYSVSGNKVMNKYKDEYLVDYKKTEKSFEDKITHGAIINKDEFVRDKKYQVSSLYDLERESWILSGKYIQNNRGSLYYGLIKAKEKELEDPVIDNNDNYKPENKTQTVANKTEVKENTPKTGDDTNIGLMAGAAGLALVGAAGAAGIARTRKRN